MKKPNQHNTVTVTTGVSLKKKESVRPRKSEEIEKNILNTWAEHFIQGKSFMNTFPYEGQNTAIAIFKEVKRAMNYYRFTWRGGIYEAGDGRNVRFFITRFRNNQNNAFRRMYFDEVTKDAEDATTEEMVHTMYQLYTIITDEYTVVLHLYYSAPSDKDIKNLVKDFSEANKIFTYLYNRQMALKYSPVLDVLSGDSVNNIVNTITAKLNGEVEDNEFSTSSVDTKLNMSVNVNVKFFSVDESGNYPNSDVEKLDMVDTRELEITNKCLTNTGGDIGRIVTYVTAGNKLVQTVVDYQLNSLLAKELEFKATEYLDKLYSAIGE